MSTDTDLVLTRDEAALIATSLHDFYAANRDADPAMWEWLKSSPDDVLKLADKINTWATL